MGNEVPGCNCPKCELEEIKETNCDCSTCAEESARLEEEISKMSEDGHPFKVGSKVKIVNRQWNPGEGLPDPEGTYPILALHGSSPDNYKVYLGCPRDCGVGNYCEESSEVSSKYHGKFNGLWVSIEDIEESENMKEKIYSSGKEMGVAAGEGVALALAGQGAELGYQQICRLMERHLGFTKEQLENPVVKEVVKTLTPVIFHMAASVVGEQLPYAERVKSGCELLIKDRAREHSVAVIRMFAPMMMEMASVMDPETLQQRVADEFVAESQNHRIDAEADAEAEAESAEEKRATA